MKRYLLKVLWRYAQIGLSVFLAAAFILTAGCSRNKQEASEFTRVIESLLQKGLSGDAVTTDDDGSLIAGLRSGSEYLDKKLTKVTMKSATVYSFMLNGEVTVCVFFDENNPAGNIRRFLDFVGESCEDLAKKYKGGTYYAFDRDNMVLAYSGDTDSQTKMLEGLNFYRDGILMKPGMTSPYREAYYNHVREKLGKTALTDWDIYLFRSRLPYESDGSEQLESTLAVIGSSAMVELLKADMEFILASRNAADVLFAVPEEREGYKSVIEKYMIGIVWFHKDGRRVMSETLSTDSKTGKIIKNRDWYNGYKMPEEY